MLVVYTLASNELLNPDDIEIPSCRPYKGVDLSTYSLTYYTMRVIINVLLLRSNYPAMSVLQHKRALNVNSHLSSDSMSDNVETLRVLNNLLKNPDDSTKLICKPRINPDSASLFSPWSLDIVLYMLECLL